MQSFVLKVAVNALCDNATSTFRFLPVSRTVLTVVLRALIEMPV